MVTRSMLSVPGTSERLLAKALAAGADAVIVDLEDAVAPDHKIEARDVTCAWLRTLDGNRPLPRIVVRINGWTTPWGQDDAHLVAEAGSAVSGLLLPKVEEAAHLRELDATLTANASDAGILALIESAAGLHRLAELCIATSRLTGLVIGYADLGASLGRSPSAGPELWAPAQEHVLWAGRTHGLEVIDGPHLTVDVDPAFLASVARCVDRGFDAKWVLHPRQVAPTNDGFRPTGESVVWARRVVGALEDAEAAGAGVVSLEGRMIDEAVAVSARRTLALAAAGASSPEEGNS